MIKELRKKIMKEKINKILTWAFKKYAKTLKDLA